MAELRERRRRSRRRTRLVRLDLALGVLAAIILLLISPGLAITGLVAVLLLTAVFASIAIEHRRHAAARELAASRRSSAEGRR